MRGGEGIRPLCPVEALLHHEQVEEAFFVNVDPLPPVPFDIVVFDEHLQQTTNGSFILWKTKTTGATDVDDLHLSFDTFTLFGVKVYTANFELQVANELTNITAAFP